MKCPKCGYISFDYNQVCPKCNKDISSEQAKLNILPFQPNPLSLLGALTGDVNESQIGLGVDASNILEESLPQGIPGMVDASIEETGQFAFDDTDETPLDFEGEEESEVEFDGLDESALIGEDSLSGPELEGPDDESMALESDEISLEETGADLSLEPDEDFSLDLGDFTEDDEAQQEQGPAVKADEIGAEDLTLELSKASIEESILSGGKDSKEPIAGIDMGDLETVFEEAEEGKPGPEDITIQGPAEPASELGELDIEGELPPQGQDAELKIDEIFLEETPAPAESGDSISAKIESDTGIDLEALDELDIEIDESDRATDDQEEIELHVEDLKVNETGELEIGKPPEPLEMEGAEEEQEPEEILLEEQGRERMQETLTGIEFEEIPVEEPAELEKRSGTIAQGLEETLIELDEISLSEEPIDESGESELTFDLEDLDLDLDFGDESEDDKKEK